MLFSLSIINIKCYYILIHKIIKPNTEKNINRIMLIIRESLNSDKKHFKMIILVFQKTNNQTKRLLNDLCVEKIIKSILA